VNIALARSLRQGVQLKDPRLYDLLGLLIDSIAKNDTDMASLESRITAAIGGVSAAVPDVETFTYTLLPRFVKLEWLSPGVNVAQYEIRKGTVWASAEFVTKTPTTNILLEPLTIGDHTYLIKALDYSGVYCVDAKSVVVTIPAIGSVSITANVIDNYTLLYWTIPSSAFEIVYYTVKRLGSFLGNINGTFTTIFEATGGNYTYSITPYDVAGNAGPEISVDVYVSAPADFVLESDQTSEFTGAKVNCIADAGALLVCVNTTETFAEHFTNHGWTTPQNQIDAGYPLYIQPSSTTASYQETFDFGTILTNILVTIDWSYNIICGSAVSIDPQIEVSDNGTDWSPHVHGKSTFVASLRYVRITLVFAGTVNDLMQIYNLHVTLGARMALDSGDITANAGDSGGTVVNFNLVFKDVSSITVTSKSQEPIYPIYDFTDIPNPTSFKILVFDSAGNRITRTVSWKARGIV